MAVTIKGDGTVSTGLNADQVDGHEGGVTTEIFTADGTWTKPAQGTIAFVQMWGGGGGGFTGRWWSEVGWALHGDASDIGISNGGGGGAYGEFWIPLSQLGATESVVVAPGGAAGSDVLTGNNTTDESASYGENGGNSIFAGHTVRGGNGGSWDGGTTYGGVTGYDGRGGGVQPILFANSVDAESEHLWSGSSSPTQGTNANDAYYGGSAGGTTETFDTYRLYGGTSEFGGIGGRGGELYTGMGSSGYADASPGTAPGGGGGGGGFSTYADHAPWNYGAAGARGEVRITVF